MSGGPIILWFRNDLRVADHPALRAAMDAGVPVVPVFIWAPEEEAPWAPGAASRWWLHHSLEALARSLERKGSRLILRRGPTLSSLRKLIKETGARSVFWSRRYEPAVIARDKKVKAALKADGIEARSFNANLLHEPWTVATRKGDPYQVFTPYWKACLAGGEPEAPLPAPRSLPAPARWPTSHGLGDLDLLPRIDWAEGLREAWSPGEAGADAELRRFLAEPLRQYPEDRDRPDRLGTSRLSPHLHFGEVSPRTVWEAARDRAEAEGGAWGKADESWRRQLVWREFAHHLLFHFPHTPDRPLRPEFKAFPWSRDAAAFRAWRRGRTGVPLVDAGMRELWATGWMHNRARMVVASYLVKDLLIPWTEGARWFWDTLVDADLANNTLGWQWTAGCGADAQGFLRVFDPVAQARKFDPDGAYRRRWLDARTPPTPIVEHKAARARALAAYGVD